MSLKSTTILAILLASIAFAQSKDCLKACTMEYNPICASNGKEFQIFGNPCMFEIANCEQDSVWTKAHSMANCQADTTEIAAETNCEKPCTFELNPVCGSNGFTHQVFDNLCQMENAHCMDNKVWFQTLMTDCLVPIVVKDDCNKACTREYHPVCGFNGKKHQIFNNLCDLNNAHCADGKTWFQTLMTDCLVPIVVKDDCNKACTREYHPVCGFNGEKHQIFNNLCDLNNAHCADGKAWFQTLMTDCLVPINTEDNCNTACTLEYNPVCGFNGEVHQIFGNPCALKNAHCDDGKTWIQTLMTDCLVPINTEDNCNTACTLEYNPVCGFNGEVHQIFGNPCALKNAHCDDGKTWVQTLMTDCKIPEAVKEDCSKACTREYNPVCGFNGEEHKLFGNPCEFQNAQCQGKIWSKMAIADCLIPIEIDANCEVPCTREYMPVCGYNGEKHEVFSNGCLLKNAHCKDGKTWYQTIMNDCFASIKVEEDCTKACTREYNPVCGFNGKEHKLFGNPCEFENAHCQDGETWSKMVLTDCLIPAKVEVNCEVPCTREYMPVCGFNGEDYQVFSNACELKNAHCKDANNWSQVIMASCLARTSIDTMCEKPCTRELRPVCGFNGERHQIFSNKCLMENEHCNDGQQWSQTRFDDCEVQQIAADNQKLCEVPCTREYNPVCGFNGKTHKVFGNKCVMDNEHCKDGQTWLKTRMSECSFRGPSDNTNDCPKICPLIYAPTCGFDGNTYHMFSNLCEMEVSNCNQHTNFQLANLNDCKHTIESYADKKEDCPQICPMIYAPTCGFDGFNYQMFSSPCEMKVYNCNKKTNYHLSRLSDCQA